MTKIVKDSSWKIAAILVVTLAILKAAGDLISGEWQAALSRGDISFTIPTMLVFAWGLFKSKKWAYWITLVCVLFMVVMSPFGFIIAPFLFYGSNMHYTSHGIVRDLLTLSSYIINLLIAVILLLPSARKTYDEIMNK